MIYLSVVCSATITLEHKGQLNLPTFIIINNLVYIFVLICYNNTANISLAFHIHLTVMTR